ncbi:MAG TPA: TonB-dependent receptor, partial [Myxococcaceae bacterium]|nr:TonB-dependent receptor [Myxococcaceae bacterium]
MFGVLLLGASVALAQPANSVLTGNVIDASTKAPVGDVVVTATSPGLQGEQVVVTDSSGLYRVPQLPPGTYTLRFEKESYRPYSRTAIEVAADRTLRLNVELLPETAGATEISVVGSPPTVDVGSSTVGNTVNQEFMRNIAISRPGGLGGATRSFDSLATVAPQANADIYGVGISGATSPENQYLIDGLSVNNPAYGVLGTQLSAEFVDEVNVITGGYMPEYGRTTGGTVSAVVKSGGNEFHGSVFGTFTPGSLAGAPGNIAGTTGIVNGRLEVGNFGDFGGSIGGYIIKDKLWFYAGFQAAYTRYKYFRNFNTVDPDTGVFTPIANSEQKRFGDEHTYQIVGKLTYLLSPDHRVNITFIGIPTGGGGGASFPARNTGAVGGTARTPTSPAIFTSGTFNASSFATKDDAYDIVGELNSSFLDKRLLLDIRGGWHHQQDDSLPVDGSGMNTSKQGTLSGTPLIIGTFDGQQNVAGIDSDVPASVKAACGTGLVNAACGVVNYGYGGPGFISTYKSDSYQGKAVFTYLAQALGHHVLKAGVDLEFTQFDATQGYTGLTTLQANEAGDGTIDNYIDLRRFGYLTGAGRTDAVTLENYHTLTKRETLGGFVQDSWSIADKVTLNVGLRYDSVNLKGTDGVVRLALNDQWSPRVGVVWDPTQQGRSKIFANYGRYYENIPLDIANRELSPQGQISGRFSGQCDPLAPNGVATCASAQFQQITRSTRPNRYWRVTGTPDIVPVDPDLKSPSNDEVVAGAEYEIIANARLGVSYTYRNLVRTVEDMSNDEANTYFIGNPGEGIADTFPKAKRTYNAVTVNFVKSFADLWLAQISYTWSRLTGNYDGLYRPEDTQLDPNLNSTFDLKSLLTNQDGNLSGDITHTIKAFLSKEFVIAPVFSIVLGGSFNGSSGPPINFLGAQQLYGPGQAYILTRGSGGRMPWVTSVDARLNFNYRISKDSTVTAGVDAFNIFNSQRPTRVDQNYTFNEVGPIVGGTQGTVPTQYGGVCANDTL